VTLDPIVLQAFRQPERLSAFSLAEWDLLLRQAANANLLASLAVMVKDRGLLERIPEQAQEHLAWVQTLALRHRQAVLWEAKQIESALAQVATPIVYLKGAAYVKAGLSLSRGRLFSDIDIMVPKALIGQVEAALMMQGWASTHHDAYDQRYYRTWMHELPPMQHIKRQSVIDVHHAILPETAADRPDPDKLLSNARVVGNDGRVKVLAPVDMLLHSAVHLFYDGEWDHGLRDLVDIQHLVEQYGAEPGFWTKLIERAKELELTRPLFYAMRYLAKLLDAPIPQGAMQAITFAQPNALLMRLMDALFMRALLPLHESCGDSLSGTARFMLYIRGNWLRMPPILLARHLFHKAFLTPKVEAAAGQ
jgi:hypothetical protein